MNGIFLIVHAFARDKWLVNHPMLTYKRHSVDMMIRSTAGGEIFDKINDKINPISGASVQESSYADPALPIS